MRNVVLILSFLALSLASFAKETETITVNCPCGKKVTETRERWDFGSSHVDHANRDNTNAVARRAAFMGHVCDKACEGATAMATNGSDPLSPESPDSTVSSNSSCGEEISAEGISVIHSEFGFVQYFSEQALISSN